MVKHIEGKLYVADSLSHPFTLCLEMSDKACLLIRKRIEEVTKKNCQCKRDIAKNFRLEDLLTTAQRFTA